MWELKKYRGKYAAVARINGKTIRRSSGTEDIGQAKRWFEEFKRIQAVKEDDTMSEIYQAYKMEKSENEQRLLGRMWKNLEPFFAELRPDQLSRDHAREYIRHRQGLGISNNTIIRELGSIRTAARWFDKNYPTTWEHPPKPDPKDRYLTRKEYALLLESAKAPHMKLFIILALGTAGRTSAILELKWDQIDFRAGMIDLGRGNRIKRRALVPMNDRVREALMEAYNARTSEHVIEYGSNQVQSIKKGFELACKRAGLKNVTPHTLRHSAAVWLAEAGTSMSEIAQFLGHSSTAITEKVYARYSPDYLRKASDILQ